MLMTTEFISISLSTSQRFTTMFIRLMIVITVTAGLIRITTCCIA
jgi:hypothetical protein